MPSQPSTIRNAHHNLMEDFRLFINGTTVNAGRCNPLELTRASLTLLKALPATRDAVFQYFCGVFDNAAQNYILRLEAEIATGNIPPPSEFDEIVISEIHGVLCGFVKSNAEAWAPIISTWSLELLGELSTRYAGRAHISTGLNETLQLWMNCRATRTLIDITTQCLHCLINSDTETCISALLDTSVKHSPNFDWVVAHVGSCFPNTVITRVLSCGLKDFCQNKSYEQGCDSPKLKSVVGILGHLAGSHSDDIQKALLDIFKWSLMPSSVIENDPVKAQRKATVPFLLQLSYLSSTLLSSICSDIRRIVSPDVIIQLYGFTDDWCKYFGSSEALEELLVGLILKCEKGGSQIINLLLDCVTSNSFLNIDDTSRVTIKEKAQEMLESVLQEVDYMTRHEKPVSLLDSILNELSEIHQLLLSKEKVKSQTAARIIIYLGHNSPSVLVSTASYLFQKANTLEQLALLVRILTSELTDKNAAPYSDKGGYFAVVLEQILSKYLENYCVDDSDADLHQMWHNLLILLRWEKQNTVQLLRSKIISQALFINLTSLTSIFKRDTQYVHKVGELLDLLEVPSINKFHLYTPPVQVVINFTLATVNYFFKCCGEDHPAKERNFRRAREMLKRLCVHSKVARVLALRELLERCLFRKERFLFGAKDEFSHGNGEQQHLLLKQNKKMSKTIPLTKHSSVFNGGIVGSGKRKANTTEAHLQHIFAYNVGQFIDVIKACCFNAPEGDKVVLESVTQVSLLLVQFVSPDVMYNGLPWPEEEFSKVTIERDLSIRRMFANIPVLWDLLSLVAMHRPALCYCSVLLRALTATLIHQWNSTGEQSKSAGTSNYQYLMDTTTKVVDIMALGQLLPPPLSGIKDILPHLKCFEIVAIFKECVWCYMRDHIPSPELFGCDSSGLHWRDPTVARPPEIYTNTLRIIMQRNIKTVGPLYNQLFLNVVDNE